MHCATLTRTFFHVNLILENTFGTSKGMWLVCPNSQTAITQSQRWQEVFFCEPHEEAPGKTSFLMCTVWKAVCYRVLHEKFRATESEYLMPCPKCDKIYKSTNNELSEFAEMYGGQGSGGVYQVAEDKVKSWIQNLRWGPTWLPCCPEQPPAHGQWKAEGNDSSQLWIWLDSNFTMLQDILNNEDKFDEFIRDLPQMKALQDEKEMLLTSNKSLAEYNLSQVWLIIDQWSTSTTHIIKTSNDISYPWSFKNAGAGGARGEGSVAGEVQGGSTARGGGFDNSEEKIKSLRCRFASWKQLWTQSRATSALTPCLLCWRRPTRRFSKVHFP